MLTIYKSFLRPHLDCGDIIYGRTFNESFQNKLQSVKYNATLAITAAIRGSSRQKLYQELGLESLKSRPWYQKLCLFFELKKNKRPSYLFDIIPKVLSPTRMTRNHNNIPLNMNTSKTLFFHPLLLSGISSIIIFESRNRLVLLKKNL